MLRRSLSSDVLQGGEAETPSKRAALPALAVVARDVVTEEQVTAAREALQNPRLKLRWHTLEDEQMWLDANLRRGLNGTHRVLLAAKHHLAEKVGRAAEQQGPFSLQRLKDVLWDAYPVFKEYFLPFEWQGLEASDASLLRKSIDEPFHRHRQLHLLSQCASFAAPLLLGDDKPGEDNLEAPSPALIAREKRASGKQKNTSASSARESYKRGEIGRDDDQQATKKSRVKGEVGDTANDGNHYEDVMGKLADARANVKDVMEMLQKGKNGVDVRIDPLQIPDFSMAKSEVWTSLTKVDMQAQLKACLGVSKMHAVQKWSRLSKWTRTCEQAVGVVGLFTYLDSMDGDRRELKYAALIKDFPEKEILAFKTAEKYFRLGNMLQEYPLFMCQTEFGSLNAWIEKKVSSTKKPLVSSIEKLLNQDDLNFWKQNPNDFLVPVAIATAAPAPAPAPAPALPSSLNAPRAAAPAAPTFAMAPAISPVPASAAPPPAPAFAFAAPAPVAAATAPGASAAPPPPPALSAPCAPLPASPKAAPPGAGFASVNVDEEDLDFSPKVSKGPSVATWDNMTEKHMHVSTNIVDDYVEFLTTKGGLCPENVATFTTLQFQGLVLNEESLPTTKKMMKKFRDRIPELKKMDRLLWVAYRDKHFAVLDIYLKEGIINVYDSISGKEEVLKNKWAPQRLRDLVACFVEPVGSEVITVKVEIRQCSYQRNTHDCGIYAMANMRSLLSGCSVRHKQMVGTHMGKKRAGAVLALRKQLQEEFKTERLLPWWEPEKEAQKE